MDSANFRIDGIQRHQLDNGLTILMREDHTVPIVSTMMWYRVGSRFEQPGVTGISHFLEHMMFKGTSTYQKGEIDSITACKGGSNNAFTSNDYTAYYFSFASDRWQPALEIEADRMMNNRFDPEEFELERQVIIEELKMDCDSPWGALRRKVEINSFEKHPYRFPVIGHYEDVASITRAQMIDHYRQFYTPANATLVLVGDFQLKKTLQQVEKLFAPLPQSEVPTIDKPREPRRTRKIRVRVTMPTQIPRILVAFTAPSVHQKGHYALRVLDSVLSEGKLSRLYLRLVEKEHVASLVSTEFSETFDPYLFFIGAELHEEVDLGRVESMIFEEMDKLKEAPISESELRRAKNQCLTQFFSGFETTLDQAIQIGLLATLDCFEFWDDYARRITRLTAEEVREVAAEYCIPRQATVGMLLDGPIERESSL